PSMCTALRTSIFIGLFATLGATILGTLAAFALVRHQFVGRSGTNVLIFLPMAAPEIVMGSSLLALFVAGGFAGQLGFFTILIAHIMFCLSFVIVTVRSRLAGLSDTLEQAAADLYATPQQAFWKVTFPLVFPGILGAALLSFSLSFDDFIITNLNAGTTTTFPMYVYGVSRRTIPMQINVVGTLMLIISVLIVVGGEVRSRARTRALAGPKPVRADSVVAAAGARSSAGALDAVCPLVEDVVLDQRPSRDSHRVSTRGRAFASSGQRLATWPTPHPARGAHAPALWHRE